MTDASTHLALADLAAAGFSVVRHEALAGDVSQRRYLRLWFDGAPDTAVLALYPPTMAAAAVRYRRATELLEGVGVGVPRILAQDPAQRWMLTEDAGTATLFDRRDRPWRELEPSFEAAVGVITAIGTLPRREVAALGPPLDGALLRRELVLTWRALFEPRGLDGGTEVAAAIDTLCTRLGLAAAGPCHRDFGARNLLPRPAGGVTVIDHQDLRLGPVAYDVASLLNDSLFPPPQAEARLLAASGLDAADYHRAAAQRTLKATGTYATFAQRSPRYLGLIAPTLTRALHHLGRTPETARVAPRLAELWSPLLDEASPTRTRSATLNQF